MENRAIGRAWAEVQRELFTEAEIRRSTARAARLCASVKARRKNVLRKAADNGRAKRAK